MHDSVTEESLLRIHSSSFIQRYKIFMQYPPSRSPPSLTDLLNFFSLFSAPELHLARALDLFLPADTGNRITMTQDHSLHRFFDGYFEWFVVPLPQKTWDNLGNACKDGSSPRTGFSKFAVSYRFSTVFVTVSEVTWSAQPCQSVDKLVRP